LGTTTPLAEPTVTGVLSVGKLASVDSRRTVGFPTKLAGSESA
jgi:hypothetical protein